MKETATGFTARTTSIQNLLVSAMWNIPVALGYDWTTFKTVEIQVGDLCIDEDDKQQLPQV